MNISAWDRRIFAMPIVRELATFGSHRVHGAFTAALREISLPGGALQAAGISFECPYAPEIGELSPGDEIAIASYGVLRFVREVVPGGDESGLTVLELEKAA